MLALLPRASLRGEQNQLIQNHVIEVVRPNLLKFALIGCANRAGWSEEVL
jgi:hypothetical protein